MEVKSASRKGVAVLLCAEIGSMSRSEPMSISDIKPSNIICVGERLRLFDCVFLRFLRRSPIVGVWFKALSSRCVSNIYLILYIKRGCVSRYFG